MLFDQPDSVSDEIVMTLAETVTEVPVTKYSREMKVYYDYVKKVKRI